MCFYLKEKMDAEPDDESDEEDDAGHAPDTEMILQHGGELVPVDDAPDTKAGKEDHQNPV